MKWEIIAGDTLDFNTSVPDYPPADGWTLSYRLIPRTSGTPIEFDAGTENDYYRSQVGPTTTELWTAGEYSWAAYVSKAGARYTVDSGVLTILPDPGVVSAYDGRTHARKVLEAIEAVIEGRASKDQEEYTIAGRSLKRMPIADLMAFRNQYRGEVYAQDQRAAGVGGKVVVRL